MKPKPRENWQHNSLALIILLMYFRYTKTTNKVLKNPIKNNTNNGNVKQTQTQETLLKENKKYHLTNADKLAQISKE